MSLAEEMLTALNEEVIEHTHPVTDTDPYFVINADTREIENMSMYRNVLMQYDHNSERYTFSLPRYIDGHDMSLCNSVVVNYDNVEDQSENEDGFYIGQSISSFYDVDDLRIDPDNADMILVSWLVSRAATQFAGKLSFSIEFKCVDDEGNVTYEWATNTFNDITIISRKKNTEAEVTEHVDLLEQWRTKIFGAGDSVMANIATEGEAQVAAVKMESETQQEAVELKGVNTLATIPEDYTETNNNADEALRSKGDAVVYDVEGAVISLNDSSDDYVRSLKVFGRSSQETTTGAQLLQVSDMTSKTDRGLTQSISNGVCTVTGTANSTAAFNLTICGSYYGTEPIFTLAPGTYTVKDCMLVSSNGTSQKKYEDTTFTLTEDFGVTWVATRSYQPDENVKETTYPMLNAGDTALPWEPYTGGLPSPNPNYPQEIEPIENPTVSVLGKNLIRLKGIDVGANVSFDVSDDGYTVTMVGGSTYPYTSSYRMLDVEQLRGKTVIFKQDGQSNLIPEARGCAQLAIKTPKITTYLALSDEVSYREITIPEDVVSITLGLYTNNTSNILESDNEVVIHGLMLSFENGDWEPYKEPQTIALQHSIPGIPVTSGGNYTDENGQQWICDEVDLERGVYVQRIGQYIYDGSEDEKWKNGYSSNGKNNRFELILYGVPVAHEISETNEAAYVVKNAYCSHFDYQATSTRPDVNKFRISKSVTAAQDWWYMLFSPDTDIVPLEDLDAWKTYLAENPITVMIPLTTSVETPLAAEEIVAFRQLKTNYPNTTILNDACAWMSVNYNVDTELFIKNTVPRPTDEQVAAAVSDYYEEHPFNVSNGFTMIDRATGKSYVLYINNGKLTMEVTE